jgi:hypothetical protein
MLSALVSGSNKGGVVSYKYSGSYDQSSELYEIASLTIDSSLGRIECHQINMSIKFASNSTLLDLDSFWSAITSGNDVFELANVRNLVVSGAGDDYVVGGADSDEINCGSGNDFFNGGLGLDTSIYFGSLDQYKIELKGNSFSVADQVIVRDGTDTLTNIERLQFSDKNIALDLAPTQSAGQTALLIGAVLPGKLAFDASKQALLGSVVGLFDQGFTLAQLSGAILRLPIWDVLTGKAAPTDADIAGYLVNNVYGGTQTAAITNAAITAMSAETPATQGSYLATLATSTASQNHIDLVGIQSTGLVYVG